MAIKVLYHASCYDGFGAAYAAWKHFGGEAEYIPMGYETPLPHFEKSDEVYMVDYSRKALEIVEIVQSGVNLTIIDHHKTAVAETAEAYSLLELEKLTFTLVLDMERSGAVMTYQHFFPKDPVPKLLQYVQDRDLWRFNMPDTKKVHAYLCTQPFDFTVWDIIESRLGGAGVDFYMSIMANGQLILGYHKLLVDIFCREYFLITVGDYNVPCVNTSMLFSEVPHRLLELHPKAPFAAYVYKKHGVYQYGLRSRGDFDVSKIAKLYGGGGHAAASGFETKEPLELEYVKIGEN